MSLLRRVVIAVLAGLINLIILGLLIIGVSYFEIEAELPEVTSLRDLQYQEPLRIYSADGLLMAEFGVERRRPVRYEDLPELLIQAVVATEDSRFFEHQGVDLQGLARALLINLQTGRPLQGASTITMQVARNFFLTREKTLQRKFAELLLALRIERTLEKQEILTLYLNKIFFGHRAYGVAAAAEVYYGKTLAELSLSQVAMLAGIPQAPSTDNPVTDPKRAQARRNHVLRRMLEQGYIDPTAYQQASNQPDRARLHNARVELEAPYVAERVRRELVDRYGSRVYSAGYRVTTTVHSRLQKAAQRAVYRALFAYDERHGYRGPEQRVENPQLLSQDQRDALLARLPTVSEVPPGLVMRVEAQGAEVYLGQGRSVRLRSDQAAWARPYIDVNRQGEASDELKSRVSPGDVIRLRLQEGGVWRLAQLPDVTGALVAVSPKDGSVMAMVGGFSHALSEFNRAVDSRRPPGSSFKPFVYAAALQRGWTPATLIDDEPIAIREKSGREWRPKNFDHRFLGPVRLREALVKSRNLASINLLFQAGVDYTRNFLARFGFQPKSLPQGLSLALGSGGVSPLQLAAGYAVFANGGFRVNPYFISGIEDANGRALFQAEPDQACRSCWYRSSGSLLLEGPPPVPQPGWTAERVLEPGLTYQLHSILQGVIRDGTGRGARKLGRDDIAGKTGTSNQVRDSWFCGYQQTIVAAAWMGFDGFQPLGKKEHGGRAALAMWVDFMAAALEHEPTASLPQPPGLTNVRINRYTGSLTDSEDPDGMMETVREQYKLMLLGPPRVRYRERVTERVSGSSERILEELF